MNSGEFPREDSDSEHFKEHFNFRAGNRQKKWRSGRAPPRVCAMEPDSKSPENPTLTDLETLGYGSGDQAEWSSPRFTSRKPSAGRTSTGNPPCQSATPRRSLACPAR